MFFTMADLTADEVSLGSTPSLMMGKITSLSSKSFLIGFSCLLQWPASVPHPKGSFLFSDFVEMILPSSRLFYILISISN
jgi:hypothetical protein